MEQLIKENTINLKLFAYELYEAEDRNKEYVALIKHIERKTKTVLLDDGDKVLKEAMNNLECNYALLKYRAYSRKLTKELYDEAIELYEKNKKLEEENEKLKEDIERLA